MMGPPRVPGTHPMDPSGNPMMPPPNQNQSYPSMHPYSGGQPYRNQQMPPYGNYQNNPVSLATFTNGVSCEKNRSHTFFEYNV